MSIQIDDNEVPVPCSTPLPAGGESLPAPGGDADAPARFAPAGLPDSPSRSSGFPAMELTPACGALALSERSQHKEHAGDEFPEVREANDEQAEMPSSRLANSPGDICVDPRSSRPGVQDAAAPIGTEMVAGNARLGDQPQSVSFHRTADIAAFLGVPKRSVQRQAKEEGWPSKIVANRIDYAPPFEMPAPSEPAPCNLPPEPSVTFTAAAAHSAARRRALERETAVQRYCTLVQNGTPKEVALVKTVTHFAAQETPFLFSAASLRRWVAAYVTLGLNGLVDQKQGRVGRKKVSRFLSDDQVNRMKADGIEHGSIARAARNLMRDPELHAGARTSLHGGHASKSYVPPSIREAAKVSPLTAALHTGARAARLMTSSVHSDPASVKCGDVYVADDETPNVYVWEPWPNRLGYRIGRPQILQVADVASLMPLNIRVVMRASGAYTADDVAGTLGDTFDTPGLPNVGLLLEGGVWRSNLVIGHKSNLSVEDRIGGLASLGLEVFHARTPMAKWEIEGQFHLQQHIMDKVPGYCGRNERTDLPEKTKRLLAQAERGAVHPSTFLLSLSQFADHVQDALREYSHERQDGKTLRGASPWEKWNDEAPKLRVMAERDKWLYRSSLCVTTAKQNGELKVSHGSGRNQRIYYYHNANLICPRAGQEIYVYWNDHNPQADAVLLAGTTTNPNKRVCIGTAQYVREISRFKAGKEDIGEAMGRKAAELQYAKSELRTISPHLSRTAVPVSADAEARRIGQTIADAAERHEETVKVEARVKRSLATAVRNAPVTESDREAIVDRTAERTPEFQPEEISNLFGQD